MTDNTIQPARDVERTQQTWSSMFPPPSALCGEGGCTFLPFHDGEHSWGGAS